MRTDLAIETPPFRPSNNKVRKNNEICKHKVTKNILKIEEADEKLSLKPKGEYITIEFRDIMRFDDKEKIETEIINALKDLNAHNFNNILIAGLGNEEITSDSIGPKIAKKLLATRHISEDLKEKIGLKGLKSVSVITPDVLGKTGIETFEIIKGIAEKTKPDLIIVADALASASYKRLFTTIQLTNTGIAPGSGVKNKRKEISQKTMGVPVIAIGVPTVVDAASLSYELTEAEAIFDTDLIVTPKDVDLLCHKISEIISTALNIFLQPEIDPEIIKILV